MRILFSSGPLYGHVNTMLPLALAAQRAGHRVVFATGPELVPHVARRGLTAWSVGLTHAQAGGSRQESWLRYFELTAERRAADLLTRAAAWRPDLVIHEETELAGAIVAAHNGARQVVHGLGLMPPARVWMPFVEAIGRVGRQWGVRDPAAALGDATYLHICPPALQADGASGWQHVQPLRPVAGTGVAGERLPAPLDALPFAQTVHLTLGTVFNGATAVLEAAIDGLRTLDANLVVTVGPDVDPVHFGPQPPHVRIERYLPHALLLPRCSLVVSQGGAGVLFGALSHGLPQLILPQGADQFMNADAGVRAGAALALATAELSPQVIADAARRLLAEPAFVQSARAVQAEIAAMPDADAVLVRLAETMDA